MYVIASFEHSSFLELAITDLELKGIKQESIFAIPLVPKLGQTNIFDTIHRSDGISLFDAPALIGVFTSVIGATYGFVLKWGPILWGLIGLALGISFGFIIEFVIHRKKLFRKKIKNGPKTEVVLMINCSENQADMVEVTLYNHFAVGVAKLNLN
jgi:putative flippase GtrA